MPRHITHTSSRGFTALELIIVLVIGFSIIAMSASKMGDLFNNSKITRAVDNIMQLSTSLGSLQGANGLGTINVQMAIDNDLIPKTLKVDNVKHTITNEWGGSVDFDNKNDQFTLGYTNIPKKSCAKLAHALISSGALNSLQINGTPMASDSSAADIMNQCSKANPVTFKVSINNDSNPPVAAGGQKNPKNPKNPNGPKTSQQQ